MAGLIEKKNVLKTTRLIWLDPFGVPVHLHPAERLRIEFRCSEEDVQLRESGNVEHFVFPPDCEPRITVERVGEIVEISLHPAIAEQKPDSDGLIRHLRHTILATEDSTFAEQCIRSLSMIDSVASIRALYRLFCEADPSDEPLRIRIIYGIARCKIDDPEKRAEAVRYDGVFREAVADRSNTSPEFCEAVFRLMDVQDYNKPDQIGLLVDFITGIGETANWKWKSARRTAIKTLKKLAPEVIQQSPELFDQTFGSIDPIYCCNVCRNKFPKPKEPGFICDRCGAEVGVDDDHHYQQAYFAKKRDA